MKKEDTRDAIRLSNTPYTLLLEAHFFQPPLDLLFRCTRKSELLFVKDFLRDNNTEFIEILHTVTLRYVLSTLLQSI